MKNIKIIFALVFAAIFAIACRTDDLLTLNNVNNSTLDALPSKNYVLYEPTNNQNPLVFTVTWTETTFLLSESSNPSPGAPVNYELEMDLKGNNFANPQVLASTNSLYANILTKDLNQLLLTKYNANPDTPLEMQMRIVAYYGENKANVAISENVLDLMVTAYKPLEIIQAVYLLGDMNGWNNTNTDYIMYRDTNSLTDNTYTYTGRLAANTYFKFLPEESLGTYKAYGRKDEISLVYEESSGGAFYNQNERYVTITINTKDLTYSIVDFDAASSKVYNTIGPIGGFTNWDNEPPLTKSSYDPHQWLGTFKFDISTAVKFRAENNWGFNWGGKDTDFPYGKAIFDGPGANVTLPGTYKIHFNDLTGHYVILQQ